MKYYVRKDASSQIEGPFELEALKPIIDAELKSLTASAANQH